MSIASEITRLQNAKASIKTSINAKGGTLTTETLDQYASAIDNLPSGSSVPVTLDGTNLIIGELLPTYAITVDVTTSTYGGGTLASYSANISSFQYTLDGGATWIDLSKTQNTVINNIEANTQIKFSVGYSIPNMVYMESPLGQTLSLNDSFTVTANATYYFSYYDD
jgi:hypothetical protein